MKHIALLCLLLLCSTSIRAQVSVGEKGTLKGKVYSDYYWVANHHNPNIEGENGFWFRRIYLTYDYRISESFSGRFRIESDNPGDFNSGPDMVPKVKDAYLRWQNDDHQILAGISSSPTFGLTEDVWGYRAVEKAPQDLYDFGSSRDFGLAFKGQFGAGERWNYHFFLGNGEGNNAEVDKGKKISFALSYELTEHLVVQGYADYNENADNPNARDRYTTQGFAGYRSDSFNFGALYSYQYREGLTGAPALELDLVSAFTNFRFKEKLKGYLRIDHMFDPYPGGSGNDYIPFSENAESTFLLGGLDILLDENIHLMPNIEAVLYGETAAGSRPDTDVIPRMTLYYTF